MCLPNTIQESSDEAVGYTPASHRASIFPKKFLATCTTSVPPTSSFPANKAASYAVTRLQLLFAARNPIPFPVGAQHCCAPGSHNLSDSALRLRWPADNLCPFINLPPLEISCLSFRGSNSLFSMICSLFWQNTGGWVLLRQPGAFCFALAQRLYRPGAVPI